MTQAVFDPWKARDGYMEEQVELFYEEVFTKTSGEGFCIMPYRDLATDQRATVCEAYIAHMCKLLGVKDTLATRLKEQHKAVVPTEREVMMYARHHLGLTFVNRSSGAVTTAPVSLTALVMLARRFST